jgi:hypothetical protein
MPKLDYTNDLRGLAGQTNSASSVTDNLTDVQTLGRALDWENVTPHSLNDSHVYDPGTEPLKGSGSTTAASTTVSSTAWTQAGATVTLSNLTVGASWIYVFFGGHTSGGAAGDTDEMRLLFDAAAVRTLEIGRASTRYGGGYGVWAQVARATSHAVTLEFAMSGGSGAAEDAFITAMVVHK